MDWRSLTLAAMAGLVAWSQARSETIRVECEDFRIVQKGIDPGDEDAGKYPRVGAREGASGGKALCFIRVTPQVQKQPLAETSVTVAKPGDWTLWLRGTAVKAMRPNFFSVLVNDAAVPNVSIAFPMESFAWAQVKLAGFSGGRVGIKRVGGGSGSVFLDQMVLSDDPAFKPEGAVAAGRGRPAAVAAQSVAATAVPAVAPAAAAQPVASPADGRAIVIECESFATFVKSVDAQDPKAGKYPNVGAREGASGAKAVVFKQVLKSATVKPYIETPVAVAKPGPWFAWFRGLCMDPMKPGTLVLMCDGKEVGSIVVPGGKEIPMGWTSIKLPDFNGGMLRVQRNGGSGYLYLDRLVLTDDPHFKPDSVEPSATRVAPNAAAATPAGAPQEAAADNVDIGIPDQPGHRADKGGSAAVAQRMAAPLKVAARMLADGKAEPAFLAAPGQAIRLELDVEIAAQAGNQFPLRIDLVDYAGKTDPLYQAQAAADASGSFKLAIDVPKRERYGYWRLAFFAAGQELKTDPSQQIAFGLIDPGVAARTLDPESPYGVCVYEHPDETNTPAILDAMMRVGFKWVRNGPNCRWTAVEPEKGQFNFGLQRQWAALLRSYGFMRLERIESAPAWARKPGTNEDAPPASLADWSTYCERTARAMADLGVVYEVWNEPNLETHFFSGTLEEYLALLNAAYEAIKRGDPKATVAMGPPTLEGLNGDDGRRSKTFIDGILKSGRFDVVNGHKYSEVADKEQCFKDLKVAATATGHGAKSMWFSEIGQYVWSDKKPAKDERKVAQDHVMMYALARRWGVDRLFAFRARTGLYDRTDHGLMRPILTPRPALVAQAALSRVLGKAKFVEEFPLGVDIRAIAFSKDGAPVNVLWAYAPQSLAVALPPDAQVLDIFGNPVTVERAGENVTLRLDRDPVYVTGNITIAGRRPSA